MTMLKIKKSFSVLFFSSGLIFLLLLTLSSRAETLNEIFLQRAEEGDLKSVKGSLELGASINFQKKESGWTALMLAAYHQENKLVEFLLAKGAHVDVQDKMGQTALMAAVSADKPDIAIIKSLIKYGATLDLQRKNDGATALMLATKGERIEIVKELIKSGAKKFLRNTVGETAGDIAKKMDVKELVELLEQ
jgi:ankyrin repeat protein